MGLQNVGKFLIFALESVGVPWRPDGFPASIYAAWVLTARLHWARAADFGELRCFLLGWSERKECGLRIGFQVLVLKKTGLVKKKDENVGR